MSTFNIGSQNAASIQNVGGNMVVHDGIQGTANVHHIELCAQLAQVRDEIDRLALPAESRTLASKALAEAEAEAAAPVPRANRISRALRCVTETLNNAGIDGGRALSGALALVALIA